MVPKVLEPMKFYCSSVLSHAISMKDNTVTVTKPYMTPAWKILTYWIGTFRCMDTSSGEELLKNIHCDPSHCDNFC